MASEFDPKKEKDLEVDEQVVRSQIVIVSTKMKTAEKMIKMLQDKVEDLSSEVESVKCNGPARLPRKTLGLTVRKSPCGNGTETFDRYEMRIFKRVITLWSPQSKVNEILSSLPAEADVLVEVTTFDNSE